MAFCIKKIALCVNPDCGNGNTVALAARAALEDAGHEIIVSTVQVRRAAEPEARGGMSLEEAVKGADMIITFGGDGTILKTARAVMGCPVPILGVNLGHKGFMAELEPDEFSLMLRAAAGEFIPIKRMMLDVEIIRNGKAVFGDSALNDAVVGCTARAMNLAVFGDNSRITAYSGDGVIVATPTGSTAYSLSAGGPLVEPEAENIILTPICAHLMNARPFVLAPDRVVTVQTENNSGKTLWLSVDGSNPEEVLDGDKLKIVKSKYYTLMAHVSGKSFYDRAFKKLGG